MDNSQDSITIINSLAPIRICDIGGWTDTWFARHGRILNLAVSPFVEVQIIAIPSRLDEQSITINVENYNDHYVISPVKRSSSDLQASRHPLIEASIAIMDIPGDISLELTIHSDAPSGASTGTSAALGVALIGALDLLTPGRLLPDQIAKIAHDVETKILGQESGIQDQLCSVYGGINWIVMDEYPHATVTRIDLPDEDWWELERRLALIYLGKSHHSSDIHTMIIRELEGAGPECKQLEDLRQSALKSYEGLVARDFNAFGRAMIENTEAQRRLHPDLVCPDAEKVIEIAKKHGALGWKVNGAGGLGGSLTILSGERSEIKHAMCYEIEREYPLFKNIPISLSREGLRVWDIRRQGILNKL